MKKRTLGLSRDKESLIVFLLPQAGQGFPRNWATSWLSLIF